MGKIANENDGTFTREVKLLGTNEESNDNTKNFGGGDITDFINQENISALDDNNELSYNKKLVVPTNTVSIAEYAFYSSAKIKPANQTIKDALTEIEFNSKLENIKAYAFYSNLFSELEMPTSLVSIGIAAFENCVGLTELTLNEGLDSIGDKAFNNCNITGVFNIPSTVTSIGTGAFTNNPLITQVNAPSALNPLTGVFDASVTIVYY